MIVLRRRLRSHRRDGRGRRTDEDDPRARALPRRNPRSPTGSRSPDESPARRFPCAIAMIALAVEIAFARRRRTEPIAPRRTPRRASHRHRRRNRRRRCGCPSAARCGRRGRRSRRDWQSGSCQTSIPRRAVSAGMTEDARQLSDQRPYEAPDFRDQPDHERNEEHEHDERRDRMREREPQHAFRPPALRRTTRPSSRRVRATC